MGGLAAIGSQSPEAMVGNPSTPEEVLIGSVMFACGGIILLFVPLVAGIVSFRMAKPADPIYYGDDIPPAS
jgi:hypothetical protein